MIYESVDRAVSVFKWLAKNHENIAQPLNDLTTIKGECELGTNDCTSNVLVTVKTETPLDGLLNVLT